MPFIILSLILLTLQLCLHITPLCDGNLHISGVLFSLGVDASSDLPPNSPLQSVMHSASQFQLAGSAKDSVLHQTKPDLGAYATQLSATRDIIESF